MSAIILANLEKGAYGVAAGLDYKPAYFATTDEVIEILKPTRTWRSFFPNHDRLKPEWNYSSRRAMQETTAIGDATGLLPVFTHMKAPDGGVAKMRERFKDPALRARIIQESNDGIAARFTGPEGIMLNETGRRISDIVKERGFAIAGEAVVSVLETEFPSMIATFGAEEDLMRFLQHPDVAVACDCGHGRRPRRTHAASGPFRESSGMTCARPRCSRGKTRCAR